VFVLTIESVGHSFKFDCQQVQWNVCHALSNLFLNETLRLQDMDWYGTYACMVEMLFASIRIFLSFY